MDAATTTTTTTKAGAMATDAFGSTGHRSSRLIFGAAALGAMKPERAIATLELIDRAGINHIDSAAAYGDSELRLAPWLAENRERVFLATKTGERSGEGARRSLENSLERMGVDHVDLIQLHNLVDDDGWQTAHGPDGAVAALARARDEGLVRFIGVTGHGMQVARKHIASLDSFPFDAVLVPLSYTMMQLEAYAADFERLADLCRERGVALQTIKSVARRRWVDAPDRRFSWYEPLRDTAAIERAMRFVLSRPAAFLNTTSDATLLPAILDSAERIFADAAGDLPVAPEDAAMAEDVRRHEMRALFGDGQPDGV